jgi:hypothetical protein
MKQIEWSRVRLSFIALLTSVAAVNIETAVGSPVDGTCPGIESG